ncbi:MAG: TetR family transcriptional regulator [Candidatus Aminicenantes bacterium]|nr:TetR family transcriptional regulator [Candidatus Aminicenantes bacterium]MDH5384580.1 TetR family transcriptional regulator [Candidatus Aminicenantes bacterium]MDH5742248.1 TetR family transcriptional regulator [Candidatus Aminicenantes bacterium]
MEWIRARTDKQKEYRISEIVAATARLYNKHSFEEITFSLIAKEAKFTRSNLYKYFNSKEEIFLEFLKHDLMRWRKDTEKAYQKDKAYSVDEFASIWVKMQVKHVRLLNLISILYTHLEKNSSLQNLIDFKKRANEELMTLSELLCGLFPLLTLEKVAEFLNLQLAAAIGLYQMTNLSEVQRIVLEYPEFEHFKLDFKVYFQKTVEHLLQGLLH